VRKILGTTKASLRGYGAPSEVSATGSPVSICPDMLRKSAGQRIIGAPRMERSSIACRRGALRSHSQSTSPGGGRRRP